MSSGKLPATRRGPWSWERPAFSMVNLARWLGIHAEDALRQANARFRRRYTTMEELAANKGLDFLQLH